MKITIQDIVKNDLCTGCGLCVSESAGTLKMQWDEYGFLKPSGLDSGKAIRVCPFNPSPEREVKDEDRLANIFLGDSAQYDDRIGRFINTYVGYSKKYRQTSSSGGIATYIFEKLLEDKIVDHLYIVKETNGTYQYQLFSGVNDIKSISKTRYIPVTLEDLFVNIGSINGKIAISGVACFIKAVRLKQYYHPELKEKIPFLIGIICGGWKSTFFTDFLAQNAGIKASYCRQEYRIKDAESTASDYSFGAYDMKVEKFKEMKMATVGDMWGTGLFKSNACDFCTDVLTELADISLGDAWLPEYRLDGMGNSVVVTRSGLADQLIRKGIERGELFVCEIEKQQIILSQKASFAHRRDAVKFRLSFAKLRRKLVPYIRERTLNSISLAYKVVQLQRMRVRTNSLVYWQKTKNIAQFNLRMSKDLSHLRLFTRIYHKLR